MVLLPGEGVISWSADSQPHFRRKNSVSPDKPKVSCRSQHTAKALASDRHTGTLAPRQAGSRAIAPPTWRMGLVQARLVGEHPPPMACHEAESVQAARTERDPRIPDYTWRRFLLGGAPGRGRVVGLSALAISSLFLFGGVSVRLHFGPLSFFLSSSRP